MTDRDLSPAASTAPADVRGNGLEDCRYCGARLNPCFYFCVNCATPYKDVGTVLPTAAPPVLEEYEIIRLKAPHAWPLFWTYMIVVLSSAAMGGLLLHADQLGLALVLSNAAILVTTCVFAAMHTQTLWVQLRRFGLFRLEAMLGLLALVPFLSVNFLLYWLVEGLGGDATTIGRMLREAGMSEAGIILAVAVFPAVSEEIAFRGLLQHWLQVAVGPWRAIVLASFLFMALHLNPNPLAIPYLFGLGVVLGWVKWRTESLYPSMLIH